MMMEQFAPALDIVSTCLDLFSIVVLIWGVVVSAKDFFISRFKMTDQIEKMQSLVNNKNQLGTYVLLSLEILIAADIIDSIVQPTLEDIIMLAAIVAIRTVISYFLHKEIQSTRVISKKSSEKNF